MVQTIKKVAVLGAGVMGSQIAAHMANAGLNVILLDRVVDPEQPNLLALNALKQLSHPKSGAFMSQSNSDRIQIGNFDADLELLADADLIIEAVAEIPEIKHDVWALAAKVAKPDAVLATNTSGIPIQAVSAKLSVERQAYFVGMHFFNPPRFMKLLELIPLEGTKREVVTLIKDFSEIRLGKGVVIAKDTTNFIGNRIGTFSSMDVFKNAEKAGLSLSEVDALTGVVVGHPKSATFRTSDLVGLDIVKNVAGNMAYHADRQLFVVPALLDELVAKGLLGDKTGGGFYKRDKQLGLLEYDAQSHDYVPKKAVDIPLLAALKGLTLPERLQHIFAAKDDKYATFAWESLRNVMWYAACCVPEITNDYLAIDRAMVWGYNWEIGPFKVWDLLGKAAVIDRMEAEGLVVPTWVKNQQTAFYSAATSFSPFKSEEELVETTVAQKSVSKLVDFGDEVLGFKLQSANNTITTTLTTELNEALDLVEAGDYKGLVIYAPGKNFSVGANLYEMLSGIKSANWQQISAEVDYLQQTTKRLKYFSKPVVTAVKGRVLGGGAEVMIHSPFVVAAAESYIGLVEVGVGLIPGGGGNKEMIARALRRASNEQNVRLDGFVKNVFTTIFSGFVSSSAFNAKEHHFLRETDLIVMNEDRLLEVAKAKILFESQLGYIAQREQPIKVLGQDVKASFDYELLAMRQGNFISDYDLKIGNYLTNLLTVGTQAKGSTVTENQFLELEKELFVTLCQEGQTQERMVHMLKTGKPLRN